MDKQINITTCESNPQCKTDWLNSIANSIRLSSTLSNPRNNIEDIRIRYSTKHIYSSRCILIRLRLHSPRNNVLNHSTKFLRRSISPRSLALINSLSTISLTFIVPWHLIFSNYENSVGAPKFGPQSGRVILALRACRHTAK